MIGYYNYTVYLTYVGVCCGLMGIYNAMDGNISWAMLFLILAGFCDMFDGTIAKTRKRTVQEQRFGIQIDSFSDLICFGVLPAIMGYQMGMKDHVAYVIILLGFTLAALIRLAYFNVMEEERQQTTGGPRKYYEGLPVTNVALILPVLYSFRKYIGLGQNFLMAYSIALAVIAIAFVIKFRMIKLQMKGMLVVLALGIVEFIWFISQFSVGI